VCVEQYPSLKLSVTDWTSVNLMIENKILQNSEMKPPSIHFSWKQDAKDSNAFGCR